MRQYWQVRKILLRAGVAVCLCVVPEGLLFELQASSIEECCEWAIALREAIALSSSTGAAAGSSGGGGKQHNRLSLSQR